MSNGTPTSTYKAQLVVQVGMPPNVVNRSREIIYDALQQSPQFIKNPYGPQLLALSRMNHRW